MKASIRNRLFLITYGLILVFIAGLIVLNNIFLERYYTESREKSLIFAFSEVVEIDLDGDADQAAAALLAVESAYNIRIIVMEQNPFPSNEPDVGDLPPYVTWIYGDRFSIRGHQVMDIITTFDLVKAGTSVQDVEPVAFSGDGESVAYLSPLVANSGQTSDQEGPSMHALCVSIHQDNGLDLYYVLTVTIQSISDSIAIFNTFTVMVGMVFMVLGGVATYLYSNRFTNPILQMTEVTKQLADLNFNSKVEVGTPDELGELGASINKMSDQLEHSIKELQSANDQLAADIRLKTNIDTMRKEFIANASHELKTPISLIIGYSEAMRLPNLKPEEINEYLGIIDDEANKMNRLVMNLLKISQLESGFQQTTMMDFSIKDLVDETVKLFSIKFTEKKAVFQEEVEDTFLTSDYDSLQTVLNNYLSNALNHLDGDRIIRITSSRREDGWLRLTVFNTGKPIPEDSLERIWESFYKVDKARTRAYGGQGLGLSIVKITLQNLGYRFGVDNLPDGVAFYFELPLTTMIDK